ncbi:ATP-dependent DNA helicase PcrA [Candidatus Clavichlamydia salmonicola]|uniref:ATP-dependent helicase n=1 Tax=Candidatus Clavichlamydia salmonicola TaxID=469812 RepID=UPI0018912A76|nr:UvrD-helicase domain-containing protein [Candidatus Clavichlamydia salmonicola]MBF5050611.1 ATP-dependent DNA helicase PcrA [Candidatus Clavichlamydia salmonicola]
MYSHAYAELNPIQEEAVHAPLHPLLILAGAGSGKTRVVTCRILKLIEKGIHPSEIVAVTFTNKAAREIEERVLSMTKELFPGTKPIIGTFHSLGVRILRQFIHLLGYNSDFSIYDQNDSQKILKNCLQTLNIKTTPAETFQYAISSAKGEIRLPEDLTDAMILKVDGIKDVYKSYQETLKQMNAVDFDDLLFLSVRLFKLFPEALEHYQENWKALLIDEYQDTNHAQYLMAESIVRKHRNLFAVGDPDQSIYSWRGANIQNILNFERDYPGARIIRLEQNYRSQSNILNAANVLICNNASRYKKSLWSSREAGEKIHFFLAKTEKDEAEFVAREVERLLRTTSTPVNEICIFYRTNFQSRAFEDVFLRKKIPYEIIGGLSFYQRKEIKDLLSFLRVLCSDRDFIAFERALGLPKRGFGPTSMEALKSYLLSSDLSLLESCHQLLIDENPPISLNKKQRAGLSEFVTFLFSLKKDLLTEPLHEVTLSIIRRSGYLDLLKEDPTSYEDRKSNLDELVSKTYEWGQQNSEGTLANFLEDLALKSSREDTLNADQRLKLMTIHNGKGLEFSVAFIVGLEENLFPHANSKGSYEGIEEERRLCYVGITRAKDLLYLTAARSRFLWGSLRIMKPSRFLQEIPNEYLKTVL